MTTTKAKQRKLKTHKMAKKIRNLSKFDTTDFFKLGDTINAEWTINNNTFWWEGKIVKVLNTGYGFGLGKPCRKYTIKYVPRRNYPNGKLMIHCFLDEQRFFDVTSDQIVSYHLC
jgi:hypothetical protein